METHFQVMAQHIREIALSFCVECWLKIPVCFIMGAFAFFFGIQNGSLLLALTILVAFDTFMGIAASYFEGKPIESRRALKAASKLAVYAVLCSSAYLVEGVVPSTTLIDEAMISFLALTEFISIMENAGRMGFSVPQKLLNQLNVMRSSK